MGGYPVFASAIPLTQSLVDPAVRIAGSLLAGEFLLHAGHTTTERFAAGCGLGGLLGLLAAHGGLQVAASSSVVGGATLGVQPTLGVLAFATLPGRASHGETPRRCQSGWGMDGQPSWRGP